MADIEIINVLDSNSHNLLHNAFFQAIFDLNSDNHNCQLLNENSFIQSYQNKSSGLIFGLNVQSLAPKFAHFSNMIDQFNTSNTKIPVFCLQELSDIDPDLFNIPGYSFYYNLRTASRGGGGRYLCRFELKI